MNDGKYIKFISLVARNYIDFWATERFHLSIVEVRLKRAMRNFEQFRAICNLVTCSTQHWRLWELSSTDIRTLLNRKIWKRQQSRVELFNFQCSFTESRISHVKRKHASLHTNHITTLDLEHISRTLKEWGFKLNLWSVYSLSEPHLYIREHRANRCFIAL